MYEPLITASNKKYGNNRRESYSIKLNRTVYLFSNLEYEHWLQIEANPDIIDYCEQPLKMEIIVDNQIYFSIIDMWVKYKNGEQFFIEIKYTSDLVKDSVQQQLTIQQLWCKANKVKHLLRTEQEIKLTPVKLSNLKFLIKSVKNTLNSKQDLSNMIESYIKNQPKTIQQLALEVNIELNKVLNIVCLLL